MDEKLRNEEKEDEVFEIMGDSVIVEVKDKTTGKVYRRELPIDFYENANVLRLLGENQDGSLSEIVLFRARSPEAQGHNRLRRRPRPQRPSSLIRN